MAVFRPVCPPERRQHGIDGLPDPLDSRSRIFSTASGVIGSIYVASANSGSVMIVAGLELIKTIRYPSSLQCARQACTPE